MSTLVDKLLEVRRIHLANEEVYRLSNDASVISQDERKALSGMLAQERARLVGSIRMEIEGQAKGKKK